METHKNNARTVVGLVLIAIGALFILRNYDIVFFNIPFDLTWEVFFIAFGIILLSIARNKTAGVVFIAIGLFNLFPELWPLILIAIGILIIYKHGRVHTKYNKDTFGSGGEYEKKKLYT